MLTPEFENSSYFYTEPLSKKHMDKVNEQLKKDWEESGRMAWGSVLADLGIKTNAKNHNGWFGIADPPVLVEEPHCVSVYWPSQTTGIRDKTTGGDFAKWQMEPTYTKPENRDNQAPETMDADALELQMLERELAEIQADILRKNEHKKKVMDLKLRIQEAKQFLNTI